MKSNNLNADQLYNLIVAMRQAYACGENAMAASRELLGSKENHPYATMIAYDLQTGTYNSTRRAQKMVVSPVDQIIADILETLLPEEGSLLEVGCGEATTLTGVLSALQQKAIQALGFDISWSRVNEGKSWLQENCQSAELFVADLFAIPLDNDSVDIVFSAHSLEPNGGREEEAIQECLRVARKALVLFEPIYELASKEAQKRMEYHGYVRGLKAAAEKVGAMVSDYRLLESCSNPLNPTGVIVLQKDAGGAKSPQKNIRWRCPLTFSPLDNLGDIFFAKEVGIAYPVIRGIPILKVEHGIIASRINGSMP